MANKSLKKTEETQETLRDAFNNPQATTREDVEGQDSKTRLWQSLDTTYNNRINESNKAYDQNYSQAARDALSRGMQRSSYALATQAGILGQKAKAADQIRSEQIADYQNRLTSLEQQERQEALQREQFDYQKERDTKSDQQWEKQFGYQQERDTKSDQQWQQQFAYQQQRDQTADSQWQQQFAYQQKRDETSDSQWQQQFDASQSQWQQQFAYQQKRDETADSQWQQQFDASQSQWQQQFAYQQGRDQVADSQWQQQLAYQQGRDQVSDSQWQQQFDASQEQWRQQFGYQQKSDSQKLAYSYIEGILASGGTPSDSLLEQAGLSRSDFNQMKQQISSGGYNPKNNPPPPGGDEDEEEEEGNPDDIRGSWFERAYQGVLLAKYEEEAKKALEEAKKAKATDEIKALWKNNSKSKT